MEYGAVLLLDALGTKKVWERMSPEIFLGRLEGLFEEAKGRQDSLDNAQLNAKWREMMFSDTIILAATISPSLQFRNWESFWVTCCASSAALTLVAEGIKARIPMRGAIAVGEMMLSDHAIVGPAIDEVAEWYERADWIGAVLAPSAQKIVEEYYRKPLKGNDKSEDGYDKGWIWLKWPVKMKGGESSDCYALAWPHYYNSIVKKGVWHSSFTDEVRRELVDAFSQMAGGNACAATKYDNTVAFYDWFHHALTDPDGKRDHEIWDEYCSMCSRLGLPRLLSPPGAMPAPQACRWPVNPGYRDTI
jgi:hypothetical protein